MASPAQKPSGIAKVSSATLHNEQAWAQHNADRVWLDAHRGELHAKYPKHSIAVYKGRVIAASPDEEAMLAKARRVAKANIGHVVVDYLQGSDEILIF